MSKYLELVEISEGVVVLRRSDLKDSPLVKIEFSSEVKSLLNGMEFDVAIKELAPSIRSCTGTKNVSTILESSRTPELGRTEMRIFGIDWCSDESQFPIGAKCDSYGHLVYDRHLRTRPKM